MMHTTEAITSAGSTATVRVVGNQLPSHLLGHPRSFWKTVMAPRPAKHIVEGPMFDIDEIMADLTYGVAA
jgi:hypothetical protein